MDIKQLRTVLAIAETGSLTRAATLLHVVQPALSRQLRQLEEELGTPLFERNRLGMVLTAPGRRFLDQVRVSLQALDQAKADIAVSTTGLSGAVSIGMLPSLASALTVPIITSLRRQHPDLRVSVTTGFTPALQDGLERGQLDIGLLGDYRPSELLSVTPVLREPLHVVGLPCSGLRITDPVTLASVARMPLVVPGGSQGLRHLIDRACTIIGVNLNIVAESDDTSLQLELVERGVGYAILPVMAIAPELAAERLIAAPIITPELHRTVVIGQPMMSRYPLIANTLQAEFMTHLRPVALALEQAGVQWLASTP
ncbi:LysR family transcriptional regulator [Pusillimonas sp. TS35]|nr:LysR family transcriptional regulator [Pusillimonas sp. TS35]